MPTARMETARIAALLAPYLESEELSPAQVEQLSKYLDLLLKWNARMNLTAVRVPDEIVTRHFGESLFTARHLFPLPEAAATLGDVGSGAGFPGLPIAIARPHVRVTLIEAHGKKSVFLKEVVRSLGLATVAVLAKRAEEAVERFDVVTFRAVERIEAILPVSAGLVTDQGKLAALIGASQVAAAKRVTGPGWSMGEGVYFPGSGLRLLWIASRMAAGIK
jgi:16S rRNA (guanine527-N7)-methyltransferase